MFPRLPNRLQFLANPIPRTLAVLVLLAANSYSRACADQPFFMGLGYLPGGRNASGAMALSADGSTVVGWSSSSSGPWDEAYRWTSATGMVGLGDLTGGKFSSVANGVSADGSVVVGQAETGPIAGSQAFRWSATSGMAALGDLTPSTPFSTAFAASAFGSVIVGIVGVPAVPGGQEAFQWTNATGIVGLGDLSGGLLWSRAQAVSADGSVIVGFGEPEFGERALRWTEANGREEIGALPGGTLSSRASGVSADGSYIVGGSDSASGFQAFVWSRMSGMRGLGVLQGGISSLALGVSNSRVVVGWSYTSEGREGFIWDIENGMRSIHEAFSDEFHLDVSGWAIDEARGISADGLAIVGSGTNPQGHYEAWIAHLPPTIQAHLDIRPADCPNSFNPKSHGYLPVALLGAANFDVSQVNRASLQLRRADGVGQSIAPHEGPPGPHSELRDVSGPSSAESCTCPAGAPDGIPDLVLYFNSAELTTTLQLQSSPHTAPIELILTGSLADGQPFRASDCLHLLGPRQ